MLRSKVQAPPHSQALLSPEASPWRHPLSPPCSEREKGRGWGRGCWLAPKVCQHPVLGLALGL